MSHGCHIMYLSLSFVATPCLSVPVASRPHFVSIICVDCWSCTSRIGNPSSCTVGPNTLTHRRPPLTHRHSGWSSPPLHHPSLIPLRSSPTPLHIFLNLSAPFHSRPLTHRLSSPLPPIGHVCPIHILSAPLLKLNCSQISKHITSIPCHFEASSRPTGS